MVELEGISHSYGDRVALRDISLDVPSGSLFGLLGPNGGGKTTLFRILSTLLRPTRGTACVFGFDTSAAPADVRRRLGVVFQQSALDNELTVHENLRVHGALYGLGGSRLDERIRLLLDTFHLTDRRRDRAKNLSGGLQHAPDLLLLDEPTTGLDPAARRAFWDALSRLRRREGTTTMVATHLMEEAEHCDVVGIIDRGMLVALGTPDQLKRELGTETLWLETDDAPALADRIQAQFSLEARALGSTVQISHPEAHTVLSALYSAFEDDITSAMVRRPTLEDVFMVRTSESPDSKLTTTQSRLSA